MTGPPFWPSVPILLGFVAASLAMNLTPGLDMVFVIGETLKGGVRAGRWAALGIAGGSLCHATLAAAGISTLLAAAPHLLAALTYLGAGYLIWIGVGMLRAAPPADRPDPLRRTPPAGTDRPLLVFRRGVLVNLLNVKVVLFYLTFLPQFVRPDHGPGWQQVLFFGLTFNVLGTLVLLAVAAASGLGSRVVETRGRATAVMSRAAGLILIGLALSLAWSRWSSGDA